MKYLKKNWSNILFGLFIILLIIPQTRMPIQVFLQRTLSFSPSEIDKEKREVLTDYNWNLLNKELRNESVSQSENRVVLINFWATWCPPCIAELPELHELYLNYETQIDFYFITNENPTRVSRFLESKNYQLPVYYLVEKPPMILESSSLPTTYLISKKGEIVMKKVGAANWNSNKVNQVIESLLVE